MKQKLEHFPLQFLAKHRRRRRGRNSDVMLLQKFRDIRVLFLSVQKIFLC